MILIDARFEVLGPSFPVLSVSLSASQPLYTRRGTLISVGGKAENVSPQQYHVRSFPSYLQGSLDAIFAGTIPPTSPWNTISLSEDIFYKSCNSTYSNEGNY